MRATFFSQMHQLAKRDENVYLIVGDLGFSFVEPLFEEFPDRVINAGVAEQNMIGLAAGLAMAGKKVFVYSIIPFVTMRCYEQVRIDIGYQKLPVVVVGNGAGLGYGGLGATHHALEDITLMSSIPGMTVITPANNSELTGLFEEIYKLESPAYLRLSRQMLCELKSPYAQYNLDSVVEYSRGKQVLCIGIGAALDKAVGAKAVLEEYGYSVTLASFHTVKPLNYEYLMRGMMRHSAIFTFEDHNLLGGVGQMIGSFIAENRTCSVLFKAFGYPDSFLQVAGTVEYLREIHGLDLKIMSVQMLDLLAQHGIIPLAHSMVREHYYTF